MYGVYLFGVYLAKFGTILDCARYADKTILHPYYRGKIKIIDLNTGVIVSNGLK